MGGILKVGPPKKIACGGLKNHVFECFRRFGGSIFFRPSAENPQNFRLRRSKIPFKIPIDSIKNWKKIRLRRAYCNAGIFFTVSERQQWDFVFKISAVGEKIRLGSAANEILRYKMSAAGEKFTV